MPAEYSRDLLVSYTFHYNNTSGATLKSNLGKHMSVFVGAAQVVVHSFTCHYACNGMCL